MYRILKHHSVELFKIQLQTRFLFWKFWVDYKVCGVDIFLQKYREIKWFNSEKEAEEFIEKLKENKITKKGFEIVLMGNGDIT